MISKVTTSAGMFIEMEGDPADILTLIVGLVGVDKKVVLAQTALINDSYSGSPIKLVDSTSWNVVRDTTG